ncbi:hypothetical protein SAMN05216198_2480 [Halopseudomonas litoralis]|uniref:Uncharacterized protein n=1 Tax=Halopseudomonas litoralis TaxID=797277 RepID=A0A1H1U3V0_9GAMM|nr:hypothetical protein [Halopseudomonas litoralis]SDS67011.1 hypothetical protein SAMN05216198_2480 [Halopseudomonas litoralis]
MLKGLKRAYYNYRTCAASEQFPLSRMIGKNLARSTELPHAELLRKYDEYGREGFDWRSTSYFQIMVCRDRKLTDNFSALPEGLTRIPEWWVMPWAVIPGKDRSQKDSHDLEARARKKINGFFDVYESIRKNGYKPKKGGAIRGYYLAHPEYGRIFNYIDGHHRMTILNHICKQNGLENMTVGVVPVGSVDRNALKDNAFFVKGIRDNNFSVDDACKLFDHCFVELGLSDQTLLAK